MNRTISEGVVLGYQNFVGVDSHGVRTRASLGRRHAYRDAVGG